MPCGQGKYQKAFVGYGHDCHMPDELHEIWIRYPSDSLCDRIKRCWFSNFIVSEKMCQSISSHLKSHGAVTNEQRRQLYHSNFIIHPYSSFRFYWDVFMLLVNYFQLVATPLDAMLYLLDNTFPFINSVYFIGFRMTMDLLCVCDVIANFFTGYYDETKKEVSFNYGSIAIHYLKSAFVIDVLASLPTHIDLFFDFPPDGWVIEMLTGFSLLKILRYLILENLYTKVCNIKRVNYYLRQAIFIFIIITWFWLLMSAMHLYAVITLGRRDEFYIGDKEGKYRQMKFFAQHMYNGALLINNVSYGIYKPDKDITYFNRIVFWCASRVILVYILARVIEYMNAKTAGARKYKHIIQLLTEFMRHKDLPLVTQRKIIRYYEYHYQKSFYNEMEIMMTISGQLRQELVMHNCRQLVENVKFFRSLPLVVLVRIVSFLHSETYMVNDVICRSNTIGNCMYFISSGTVAVYTTSGKEANNVLQVEEFTYLGENGHSSRKLDLSASYHALGSNDLIPALFTDYGHDCHMPAELHEVWVRYPGESVRAGIKRCWFSNIIVSEKMCQSISSHLKSHGAVANEQRRQLHQKNFIIHPYSLFRFYWDIFMLIINYIQLIIAPLDAMLYIFDHTFPIISSIGFRSIRMALDLTCICDVIANFFTGYYDETKKQVSFNYGSIAKHYLKGAFTIDLLASLPTHIDLFYDIPTDSYLQEALSGLSLLKILRYVILENLYTKVCNIKRVNYYVRQSVFIFISITWFWLIVSAMHLYVVIVLGKLQEFFKADQEGKYEKISFFAQHMYNGALLINNVSYGIYKPKEDITYFNRIIFWCGSRVVLVYLLAKVIDYMNAKTAGERKYKRIVQLLTEFMRHKDLPLTTQHKIIKFYEYHYQKSFYNEKEIMVTISGQLRQELVMHNCRQLVENVKFFKSLPLVVLVRIVSFLHSETYMVNDVICRSNTIGNCMYFISSGTVAVYTTSGKEICHLHDGDYFGEVALVTDSATRVATVLAVEVCELYRLERKDFIRAIHPYPDLLAMITKIAAERREDALEIDVKFRRQYHSGA